MEALTSGSARTIAGAARICGIKPIQAHNWAQHDKEFHEAIEMAGQVLADDLEDELRNNANFIPKMFLLKKLRPSYRDSYKFEFTTEPLEKLLKELKDLKKPEEEE